MDRRNLCFDPTMQDNSTRTVPHGFVTIQPAKHLGPASPLPA
jgi:hypothetical protein